MWPFKKRAAIRPTSQAWIDEQRAAGRKAFLDGHPRQAGCSLPWALGYHDAMAEWVQRYRRSGVS